MRWLILIAFVPCAAWAKDVNIRVEYVLRQERVKPDPKIVTPTIKQSYVLHDDGSLEEAFSTGGAHPINEKRASKLGHHLKVIDSNTIKRVWKVGAQTRELTITTEGANCTAKMEIKNGAGQFTALSTDLGKTALYRNSTVESTTCKIE
jgi:hypothetical protein